MPSEAQEEQLPLNRRHALLVDWRDRYAEGYDGVKFVG